MNDASPLLDAHCVSHAYATKRGLLARGRPLLAVDSVTLRIAPGEVVALVGESGCGKTTLARMLLGLLPLTAGIIRLAGESITSRPRQQVARLVQPVFQDPYGSLNPRKSVGSIIELPLRVQGHLAAAARRERVAHMMAQVGLPERLHGRYPHELSGGQRQRVAIARALIRQPRLLICDEPTSALDVSVQAQILNLLQDLQRDLGLACLFITHNLSIVPHMAQRVAVMYLGRIVEEAATSALLGTPLHPYSRVLIDAVLAVEPGRGIPDVGLRSAVPDSLSVPGCAFHPRCPHANDRCRRQRPELIAAGSGNVACHAVEEGRLPPRGAA
jgi:peptide/nickel transport system ATP-binding protein